MKKGIFILWSLVLAGFVFADISSRLNITEEDGSPSTYPYKAKFTNGTVTDNGDGTVSISNSGGGGGGGASGQINNASTYQVPYYSVSGSSNVVSGASDLNAFPSSVTVTGSLGLTNTYGITTTTITISTVSFTNEIPYRGSGGYLVGNSSFTYGEDLGGTAGYENLKLEGLSPFIIMASSNALGREFFDGYHIYANAHMWGGDIFHPNAFPSIAQGNWNPYVRDGGFYAIDTTGQGSNDKGFFAYRVAHPIDEAGPRTVFQANTTGQFLIDNTYENCASGSATDQSCKIPNSIMFLTSSTTRGAIPCPPMTTTQRNAISSPWNGICAYDVTLSTYVFYNGSAWTVWGSGGGGGGGTPGGSSGQIQYNSVGAFAGSANTFVTVSSVTLSTVTINGRLGINTNSPAESLKIVQIGNPGNAAFIVYASTDATGLVTQVQNKNNVRISYQDAATGQADFAYQVSVGSMTGAGLATCGDATHALGYTSGTGLFSCQNVTGSGGAGSGIVSPGTFTWQDTQGITVSTLTVTSTATIQSLTEGTSTFATQSSSATLSPNAALANTFEIPLTSNVTINGPSNATQNQSITFRIQQDGATRTVTWSTGAGNFSYGSDIPAINLSTGGSKYDYVRVLYNLAANRWNVVSVIRGF